MTKFLAQAWLSALVVHLFAPAPAEAFKLTPIEMVFEPAGRGATRTFQIPALGAFMLHERNDVVTALFEEGVEAEFFGSEDELLAKCRHYLGNPQERQRIAEAGRRRCERSGYSEIDRVRAFAVALSAAITVIIASSLALPVSSTHIALGAIFGIGFLREYLENQAEKVRIIREHFNDDTEPSLFDTAKGEMEWRHEVLERALKDLLPERERFRYFETTKKAEAAVMNWQRKKLVRRAHLRTIIAAWLITVPATATIAGVIYYVLTAVF